MASVLFFQFTLPPSLSLLRSLTLAPAPILCLHSNPDTGTVVVQLTSGEVMRVTPDLLEGCSLSPWLLDSGASLKYEDQVHCEKMQLACFNGKVRSRLCVT